MTADEDDAQRDEQDTVDEGANEPEADRSDVVEPDVGEVDEPDPNDLVDTSKFDVDPSEGHLSGTAFDGSSDIPGASSGDDETDPADDSQQDADEEADAESTGDDEPE